MDFRGFHLTPQVFYPKTFSPTKMGDPNYYSYPLNGHLDDVHAFQSAPWTYFSPSNITRHIKLELPLGVMPQQSKMSDIKKNVLSYVVGGFVGSKSQRNSDKPDQFPIGEVIVDLLEQAPQQKKNKVPSSQCQLVGKVMTGIFMGLTGHPDGGGLLQSFGVDISLQKAEDSPSCGPVEDCLTRRTIRLLSECSVDSNDSDFVVFDGGTCILSDDEDDDWADYSDCDTDEEVVDEHIQDAQNRWDSVYEDEESAKTRTPTKVHFRPRPTIHVMHVWDFAHRAARVGPWEEAARDRARFKERIQRTEHILSPVLQPEHRSKIRKRNHDKR